MKIGTKILFSNALNLILIALIGIFAIRETNMVLAKLRFVEISDDLNASFLEMRLSEKNYFLYEESGNIQEIIDRLDTAIDTIDSELVNIEIAVGHKTFVDMLRLVKDYRSVLLSLQETPHDMEAQEKVREKGQALRAYSSHITKSERDNVNHLVLLSGKVLFVGIVAVIMLSLVILSYISRKISRSLKFVESVAMAISKGDFHHKHVSIPSDDEVGSVIRAVNAMSEDLAEREEELMLAKKLSSLGILTAGVAHELTNPLNNISMTAQTFQDVYEDLSDEERLSFMGTVESETDRIRDVVSNLMDFAKPRELSLHKADLNDVIRRTLPLVRNMIEVANLDIELDLDPVLPKVVIDQGQIRQVLINLISNAVQASDPRMTITVFTHSRTSGGVEMAVSDTGKGISPEQIEHLFDPFFTTKGEGGTGLGLSITYGIIKRHNGDIKVVSTPGEGSTFIVWLPPAEAEKTSKEAESD